MQLLVQGTNFVALFLCFVALVGRFFGLFLRFGCIRNCLLFVDLGLGLRCRGSSGLPGADGGAEKEAQGDGGCGSKYWFVFAGKFLKSVHGSWGASKDRFIGKVTLNVGGEGGGGFVAAGAVFLQRLHHNPIQLGVCSRHTPCAVT